ncbi:hypothetical protein RHECNPAF_1221004 [Rhizobium etli CNPAF512]|nr:hypothetical protein RHECNPAF_1221004 [Rhizobium etli CNPAF512]
MIDSFRISACLMLGRFMRVSSWDGRCRLRQNLPSDSTI